MIAACCALFLWLPTLLGAHQGSKVFLRIVPQTNSTLVRVIADRLTLREWQAERLLSRGQNMPATAAVSDWLVHKLTLLSGAGSPCLLALDSADNFGSRPWVLHEIRLQADCAAPTGVAIAPDFIWNDPLYQVIVEKIDKEDKTLGVLTREMPRWQFPVVRQTLLSSWQQVLAGAEQAFSIKWVLFLILLGLGLQRTLREIGLDVAGWSLGILTVFGLGSWLGIPKVASMMWTVQLAWLFLLAIENGWLNQRRIVRQVRPLWWLAVAISLGALSPLEGTLLDRGLRMTGLLFGSLTMVPVVLIGLRILPWLAVQYDARPADEAVLVWRRRIDKYGSVLVACILFALLVADRT